MSVPYGVIRTAVRILYEGERNPMETKVKHREWVKTAAIIFLTVLLILTFFSQTILNRSLPEVAAQYTQSGSINARIRGSGQVSANETYEVALSQTRKIRSVMVRVGDQVSAGDVLFVLEAMESDELKAAQETLEQMELSYQKSLIDASNSDSTEQWELQKKRDDYEQALTTYRLYSTMDPDKLAIALEEAEMDLTAMQQKQTELQSDLTRLQGDSGYLAALAEISTLESEYAAAEAAYEQASQALEEVELLDSDIAQREQEIARENQTTIAQLYADAETFQTLAGANVQLCAWNLDYFMNILTQKGETWTREQAQALQNAYNDVAPILELQAQLPTEVERQNLERARDSAETDMYTAQSRLEKAEAAAASYEAQIEQVQTYLDNYASAITEQQAVVTNYQKASAAGDALKAAEEALEDAVFQSGLGDASSLDIQKAKEDIEEQKALVEQLTLDADGQEITANVSGTISAINVTAGNTAGADQALAVITVADRGYTMSVTVTAEQARQVSIGDTAEIVNYFWGDITATLENIANDPSSGGQNKVLIFRISGDGVEAGSNLTLSIGQRSANYDCLVPNSAVRSDTNGSFVLVVTAKNTPLGNRYTATRVDVNVLASDDTTSAVSGLANGDFVITTSSRPLEAGDQVRLAENG